MNDLIEAVYSAVPANLRHRVIVIAKGDRLSVTCDGKEVAVDVAGKPEMCRPIAIHMGEEAAKVAMAAACRS